MSDTLFEKAARVFDGWTDPDTGARVLRVWASNLPRIPGMWSTYYHQYRCFLDAGRTVLLHDRKLIDPKSRHSAFALDLTTGRAEPFGPPDHGVMEVWDETQTAALVHGEKDQTRGILWDLQAGRELASISLPGWTFNSLNFLCDGRRLLALFYRGQYYDERVESRHYLLEPGEAPRLVMEADGYYCSHMVGHPTDPEMYAYDRWPSPKRDVEQVTTIRTLDGSFEETVKLDEHAPRPQDMWGCRDHYVWAPDGSRIISYLNCQPVDPKIPFDHFPFDWWLSALDWRTGEDYAAKYPPGRWGGHMQMTPDSRWIIQGGGPGFDKLYATEVAALKDGWNEHIICSYPTTNPEGKNCGFFPYPFVLPDGSGVLFCAGWFGPEHGVYLAEWPEGLR
ncbi:MAG: hypothetical protein ACYC6A_16120 [Armatimonadota bacterium]